MLGDGLGQTAQDHTGYRRAELSIWDWFPLGDSLAASLGEGMSTGEPLAVQAELGVC
jgi:hypothetical protein